MSQTYFGSKGTAVASKCIDCGITLVNYSLWDKKEGPFATFAILNVWVTWFNGVYRWMYRWRCGDGCVRVFV